MLIELTPEVEALLSRFSPEEREMLMKDIGKTAKVKKDKAVKELSPEYLAAQEALAKFVSEYKDFVDTYESLKAEFAKHKVRTHVKVATKGYDFNLPDTSIYEKGTTNVVATFGVSGWQDQMIAAGFTSGQVQAIYKANSTAKKKNAVA